MNTYRLLWRFLMAVWLCSLFAVALRADESGATAARRKAAVPSTTATTETTTTTEAPREPTPRAGASRRWHTNLEAAKLAANNSGKPMMIVFR